MSVCEDSEMKLSKQINCRKTKKSKEIDRLFWQKSKQINCSFQNKVYRIQKVVTEKEYEKILINPHLLSCTDPQKLYKKLLGVGAILIYSGVGKTI